MNVQEAITLIGELITLSGIVAAGLISIKKVMAGTKCLLRSEMLHIYYRHQKAGELRQYEYENFMYLYGAYKKLKGNSFIDKIYEEIKKFNVVS
mgnify:CR=1 FL=1